MGLSYQMHFAPKCSPDDTVRLSCTYTSAATVNAIDPEAVSIRGDGFMTNTVELPLWADVSFLHPGDRVTALEWHGHIASLTENGRTLSAMGSPDRGPIAWPGVLMFAASGGAIAWVIWQLGKRTRVTVTRSYFGDG
jgi:hypothetical protein